MSNTAGLAGRTALVTGAAKRLGRAVSLMLAEEGVDVCLHYNASREEAESLAADLRERGVRAWTFKADLADACQAQGLVAAAAREAGPLSILVNNASIFAESRFAEAGVDDIVSNMNVNALAPFVISREFARQGVTGHVVNFLDARLGDYDHAHFAYHLSKRLFHALTRIMAVEFAPLIQVNAVSPGLILPPEGKGMDYLERLAHTNPLKRYGSADEIADTVRFLLKTRFVTGQVINVDGGRHMRGDMYG